MADLPMLLKVSSQKLVPVLYNKLFKNCGNFNFYKMLKCFYPYCSFLNILLVIKWLKDFEPGDFLGAGEGVCCKSIDSAFAALPSAELSQLLCGAGLFLPRTACPIRRLNSMTDCRRREPYDVGVIQYSSFSSFYRQCVKMLFQAQIRNN